MRKVFTFICVKFWGWDGFSVGAQISISEIKICQLCKYYLSKWLSMIDKPEFCFQHIRLSKKCCDGLN